MKIAIIGCGEIAQKHADALSNIKGAELYAYCDQNLERAQLFKKRYGGSIATRDVQKTLNNPDIQAVYITTHTDSHYQLCLDSIDSAKHIMVEKPLALRAGEALEIYNRFKMKKGSLVAMAAFKFRFYEMVQKARTLLSSIYMVSIQIMDDPWPDNFWANKNNVGGGNVISQGVHAADLLRYFADSEPEQVYAVGGNYHQPTAVIDNLSATYCFKNGVSGSMVVGDCAEAPMVSKFMLQAHGREGSLILTDRMTHLRFKSPTEKTAREWSGQENGIVEENRHFISALSGNQDVPSTLWDGYMAQAMIEAAIVSAQKKRIQDPVYVH